MYYDPAAPVVEVWLANEHADLSRPIARLGRVDVGALAMRMRKGRTVVVTATLAPAPSLAEVVASPSRGEGVARDFRVSEL